MNKSKVYLWYLVKCSLLIISLNWFKSTDAEEGIDMRTVLDN